MKIERDKLYRTRSVAEVRSPREWELHVRPSGALTISAGPELKLDEIVRVREVLPDGD